MKTGRTALLALLMVSGFLRAEGIAGYAGSFLRLGTTAYSMGMGGGFTAALDHGFPGYHNPAAVAFLEKRNATVLHHFLPLDRYLVSASFSAKLPPTAGLSIGIVNAGVDKIDGRDASARSTDTFSTEEYAVYVSFANRLMPNLSLGVNVKMFYQLLTMEGGISAKGTGVDAGLIYRQSKNFQFGFVIQDWNASYAWNTSDIFDEKGSTYEDRFPMQIRAGFVYRPGLFDLIGDYTYFRVGDHVSANRVRIGGEYVPMERISVRAGMNNFSPTVGMGLNYTLLKPDDAQLDYALILSRRGEGLMHVFTYVLNF
ncbi:MAG: PorV/PorQ family protein [Candidatus Neomarinimicrobiota bacterium]|nr:PorV/PorQ family protein [Candidatus Neomarinimicrobiota bacterium]